MRRLLACLALAGLALAGAAGVRALEPRLVARDRSRDELLYYPRSEAIRYACLGHTGTAADLAWLRAVQYYGEHKRTDRQWTMLGHIFDIVTDLDPRFQAGFIFGGLTTAEEGQDLPAALALMDKGVAANPDSWEMAFEAGFVYYVYARDYERAARLFRRAASLPGASEATIRFAAFVSQRAGDPRAAVYLWQDLYNRTDNPEMKRKALEKIEGLRPGETHDAG